jgi:hypothetical protein
LHEEDNYTGRGDCDAIRHGKPRLSLLLFQRRRCCAAQPEPVTRQNRNRDERA